jgi:hypothetical protein
MKGEIKLKMEHEAFVELLMLLGMYYWSWWRNSCYANNHELLNGKDVRQLSKGIN